MPELLWKAYIDFETDEGERAAARALYERLIALSGHVKVWISYALFEGEPIPIARALRDEDEEGQDEESELKTVEGDVTLARQVFERGYKDLRSKGLKHEVRSYLFDRCCGLKYLFHQRVALLDVWTAFEEKNGSSDDVTRVQGMMPIVTERRRIHQETGQGVDGVCRSSHLVLC